VIRTDYRQSAAPAARIAGGGVLRRQGQEGNAFGIIEAHLPDAQNLRLPLVYPVTTEVLPAPLSYEQVISDFYDDAAEEVAAHLDAGRDVAVICEGVSVLLRLLHVFARPTLYALRSASGAGRVLDARGASVLGAPLVYRNQSLSVLSGVLPA